MNCSELVGWLLFEMFVSPMRASNAVRQPRLAAAAPHVCLLCFFQNTRVIPVEYHSDECQFDKLKQMTTSNGGSLGSCIDEERSQLR